MILAKRVRDDGHLSKEQYDDYHNKQNSNAGYFQRADASVITQRRIIKSRKPNYLSCHINALNKNFAECIAEQIVKNKTDDWSESIKEYLTYSNDILLKFGNKYGNVLSFGSGDCGQLAHGVEEEEDMMVKFPRSISSLNNKKISWIACGGLHSAAVTSEGAVYTWGCNDDGALGRSGEENYPGIVEGFPSDTEIIQIAAGDCHSAALSVAGEIYTWGCYKDKDGKQWCDSLAPDTSFKSKQTTPFLIRGLSSIQDIKSGTCFNLVKCSDGHVYSWGLGEQGQLGRNVIREFKNSSGDYLTKDIFQSHLTPSQIVMNGSPIVAKTIGCGAYHSLIAMADKGTLYTTGLNNYGQLGINSIENKWELTLVPTLAEENVTQTAGGAHSSLVLTVNGTLYSFGRGDSGQLGTVDNPTTGFHTLIPGKVTIKKNRDVIITTLTCGANHCMVLSDDNTIYTWGYGDMLALGNGIEQDESRPYEVKFSNSSFSQSRIIQLSAGGQHSMLLVGDNSP